MTTVLSHSDDLKKDGYLALGGLLSAAEIAAISARIDALAAHDSPGRIFESDDKTIRGLHGGHEKDFLLSRLVVLPRLLDLARTTLEDEVYVYQFKVNMKAPFAGAAWPWHQDYIFWRNEDGMRTPQAVTVSICLDETSEHNGPIYFIPRSHSGGCISTMQDGADEWKASFSEKLKYVVPERMVEELARKGGIVSATGRAGTAYAFDCNIVHCSPPNLSPFPRRQILITYNSVSNAPDPADIGRPSSFVSRDSRPLAYVDRVEATG